MSNNGKRVAWVTGGGSGIGEAGAEALAADGWTVVVSGRRKDALDAVVAKIAKSGGKAEAIALDVSKAADVNKAAEQILSRHGRIDLLVNSAGINVPKRSWADMELEGWDKLVEINLNGVLYCMRAVLPAMRKQKDGCIINVASWAGRHVSKMPGPAYTTTKHAVLALTHSFNMDECVNGLRACCLSPGEVATPILKLRPVVPSRRGAGADAAARRSRPHHRLRRQHAAAGLHQRDPDQPDLEPGFRADAEQPGLGIVLVVPAKAGTHSRGLRCGAGAPAARIDDRAVWVPRSQGRREARTRPRAKSFKHHENLFPETGPKTSRSSGQRRRSPDPTDQRRCCPHRRRISAGHLNPSGDDPCPSVLHFCPPPPSARWP